MNRRVPLVLFLSLGAVTAVGLGRAVTAAPVNYKLPEETAAFKPGPNL